MENLSQFNRSEYRFDDVVIERDKFRVSKNGELRSLTPRAFDVLIYLIEQRGRVVEKQEIFETIWKETFVTDNALMRTIKEIRRELGDDAASPRYIETVHKRGYRFIAEIENSVETVEPFSVVSTFQQTEDKPLFSEEIKETVLSSGNQRWFFIALPVVLLAVVGLTFWFSGGNRNSKQIQSIAVMPFVNESGNPDVEYLSDGMTETLIGSLSQLPNLNVKARSSVFRYKGKDITLQTVGRETNVQAILTGRVVQRGDELTIFLSLVDAATENNLWSRQYNRKMTNLVALQNEIARDVANGLGAKLSGADEQKVTKSYTENAEAYQLYLKGRFHVLTTRNLGAETGINYYRQAIALDPNYALAYAGIADAGIGLAFGSELPMSVVVPQAKAAARKAVELDEQLVQGHVALGSISFLFDWDWKAAENHFNRALELDRNNADAHQFYGILLCSTGRQDEGLAALKRARELDPLNLRYSVVEAQHLSFAGRNDEALDRLKKILEFEPNFYLAYPVIASVYIEKGMYAEAITAATKGRELVPHNSFPVAMMGYALAKSGKEADARALLSELLEASKDRYITPVSIALIYNALNEREETLKWLERGFEHRDLRMSFLKVEPKWNNLRDDPRFQTLLQKAGFIDE